MANQMLRPSVYISEYEKSNINIKEEFSLFKSMFNHIPNNRNNSSNSLICRYCVFNKCELDSTPNLNCTTIKGDSCN